MAQRLFDPAITQVRDGPIDMPRPIDGKMLSERPLYQVKSVGVDSVKG
jgi:hypothetical protein